MNLLARGLFFSLILTAFSPAISAHAQIDNPSLRPVLSTLNPNGEGLVARCLSESRIYRLGSNSCSDAIDEIDYQMNGGVGLGSLSMYESLADYFQTASEAASTLLASPEVRLSEKDRTQLMKRGKLQLKVSKLLIAANQILTDAANDPLSDRKTYVLRLIAAFKGIKVIADQDPDGFY